MIAYRIGNDLDLDAVITCYRACTLGGRRPIDVRARMATMLASANLVISAWSGTEIVGIARALTDGVYCTYLSDFAVDDRHQRSGIGRELIRRCREHAPQATLILLSAPQAVDYYPRIGFARHDSTWMLMPGDSLL